MFPSTKTGRIHGPDCIGRIHKKLLEKAGIEEHVRFHDLRHTFSMPAIQSGIDPKTVAEILGYISREFSLDVYTFVTAGVKKSRTGNQRFHGKCRMKKRKMTAPPVGTAPVGGNFHFQRFLLQNLLGVRFGVNGKSAELSIEKVWEMQKIRMKSENFSRIWPECRDSNYKTKTHGR